MKGNERVSHWAIAGDESKSLPTYPILQQATQSNTDKDEPQLDTIKVIRGAEKRYFYQQPNTDVGLLSPQKDRSRNCKEQFVVPAKLQ
jgi:hypothetical protein